GRRSRVGGLRARPDGGLHCAIVGGGRPRGGPCPRCHARYHAALVNAIALRLLTLGGASALLLLSGCGVDDSGGTAQNATTTDTGAPAAGSSTSSSASGDCASVQPRTDDFHQAVTLGTTTKDGLKYGDITVGTGAQAATGQHITMQYTGWLQDGTSFDSSRKQ